MTVAPDPQVSWLTPEQWAAMPAGERALHVASSREGEQEVGNNGGAFVVGVLQKVKLRVGFPWCAAYVYAMCLLGGCDPTKLPKARRAAAVREWVKWADANTVPVGSLGARTSRVHVWPKRGDLMFWLNKSGTGHIGFVRKVYDSDGKIVADDFRDPDWARVHTIEGNTNAAGSREGQGVMYKDRRREFLEGRHRSGFISMDGLD